MTPTRALLRRGGFAAYALASFAYLVWRGLNTLNPDALVYSWTFLVLEVFATLSSIVFYAITLARRAAPWRAPARGMRVDVFICTYNEPLRLLRQTVRRALAMRYPHRTWLLDDGRRPEAQALAEELGCEYLTRPDNVDYKAGNLNHALRHTDGEVIAILDADHLVRRHFLDRLLGYFDDPQVALVQTPQVFYNIDSFQHHFNPNRSRLWHEGAIFHHAMQPGADRWNAAFFVGTGAMLRRSALEAIGGFATGSVTEDAFTSMRLHAAGYRSVYHDEPLAYLLAPESLVQYLTQRLRWGQGSMQILRLENPLFRRGLSWRQRLVYFTALSSFVQAVVHVAYYLAPAIFLLGGQAPLRVGRTAEFLPLLVHIAFDVAMFKLFLGPLARPLLAECYKFLNVYIFLRAIGGYFAPSGRLRFKVTTKGRDGHAPLHLLIPQVFLLAVNVTAFGCGALRLMDGNATPVGLAGIAIATGFSGLFTVIGWMTLTFARERIAAQSEYIFPDHIAARVAASDGRLWHGIVVRVNPSEVHFFAPGAPDLQCGIPVALTLRMDLSGEHLLLHARVRSVDQAKFGLVVALTLEPLPQAAVDRLFDRFAERTMPRVVDDLMQSWYDRRTGIRGSELQPYYLALQGNVL